MQNARNLQYEQFVQCQSHKHRRCSVAPRGTPADRRETKLLHAGMLLKTTGNRRQRTAGMNVRISRAQRTTVEFRGRVQPKIATKTIAARTMATKIIAGMRARMLPRRLRMYLGQLIAKTNPEREIIRAAVQYRDRMRLRASRI